MSYEGAHLGRVIRQNLYTPVTLLLFAGLCALQTRRAANGWVRLAWGLLMGASAAVFWLTREEGVWILPGAGLLAGAAVWNAWSAESTLRRLFVPIAAALICFLGMVGAVCALNYRHYGWFGTVEFRAPEFLAAYGALQRPIPSEE